MLLADGARAAPAAGRGAFARDAVEHRGQPGLRDHARRRPLDGQLLDWTQSLPKPKAVLIVSAHWEHAPRSLSAPAAHTPLVYDFAGFHPRYHRVRYDTPDASALARRVAAMMPHDEPVHQHPSRGLDHGAWLPLMAMFPLADIPVLQLSMPTHNTARLLELGTRLAPPCARKEPSSSAPGS
ncbi:DODA-type extradiol aromatic ring-opening family dioxygenase [Streptomyces sp. NPDC093060]|uniref:DODA-type extradiol aromatic ring-opening family dioxygenase n=1 Tax=Streptomyces sp. NPDC093060 TaxID=3366019 RepID=UPI003819FCF4